MRYFVLAGLLAANVAASLACCGSMATPPAPPSMPESPTGFIARFGKPDVDDSTVRDVPRPLVLTRWLIYAKEDVRVFFIPTDDHKMNEVPVRAWQFLQFQEAATLNILTWEQVSQRMAARDSENKQTAKVAAPKSVAPKEKEPGTKVPSTPVPSTPPATGPRTLGTDAYTYFLALYGLPAEEGIAEPGKLVPGIRAKWLTYATHKVKVVLQPIDAGADENKTVWQLAYFRDPVTVEKLTAPEAALRLDPLLRFKLEDLSQPLAGGPFAIHAPFKGVPSKIK